MNTPGEHDVDPQQGRIWNCANCANVRQLRQCATPFCQKPIFRIPAYTLAQLAQLAHFGLSWNLTVRCPGSAGTLRTH